MKTIPQAVASQTWTQFLMLKIEKLSLSLLFSKIQIAQIPMYIFRVKDNVCEASTKESGPQFVSNKQQLL